MAPTPDDNTRPKKEDDSYPPSFTTSSFPSSTDMANNPWPPHSYPYPPSSTTSSSGNTNGNGNGGSSSTNSNNDNGAGPTSGAYEPQMSSSLSPIPTGASGNMPSGNGIPTLPDHGAHEKAAFPAIVAIGIIIPLLLIAASVAGCFFCLRKRRRESANAMAGGQPEMKDAAVGGGPIQQSERAYMTPVAPPPAAAAPLTTTSSASPASSQPVLLSTAMGGTYYTGIDTSDHISLTDQRSQASADTFGEEPPPPYRPRSVPPISRETSVRTMTPGRNSSIRSSRYDPMSTAGLMRRSQEVRSPFDDPESSDDEDAISQISTIRSLPRRDADRLSVVSDVSYQEEPTSTHSAV